MDSSTLVASELATRGSVIANADLMVPSSSGLRVFLAVLLGAEQFEHLHVAGVGGATVAGFGSDEAAAHNLRQRRIFEVRQTRAGAGVWVKQVPQAALSGLGLELVDDRRLEVRVAGRAHLLVVHRLRRVHMRLHEVEELLLQLQRAFRDVKQGHVGS
jgi:hypothetical protein